MINVPIMELKVPSNRLQTIFYAVLYACSIKTHKAFDTGEQQQIKYK